MKHEYLGRWHIVEMEKWDQKFVDMEVPGYILVEDNDAGAFQFGTIFGVMQCRIEPSGDAERLAFLWESDDETDPLDGRGWAIINAEGQLEGRLYFHDGGDSGFTAEKTS